jgi:hypothetical protein
MDRGEGILAIWTEGPWNLLQRVSEKKTPLQMVGWALEIFGYVMMTTI